MGKRQVYFQLLPSHGSLGGSPLRLKPAGQILRTMTGARRPIADAQNVVREPNRPTSDGLDDSRL